MKIKGIHVFFELLKSEHNFFFFFFLNPDICIVSIKTRHGGVLKALKTNEKKNKKDAVVYVCEKNYSRIFFCCFLPGKKKRDLFYVVVSIYSRVLYDFSFVESIFIVFSRQSRFTATIKAAREKGKYRSKRPKRYNGMKILIIVQCIIYYQRLGLLY